MARPIFIIRVPTKLGISKEELTSITDQLEERLDKEYHVIAFSSSIDEEVKFECLNSSNAKDIDIEKLKKTIHAFQKMRHPDDIA